MKMKRLANDPRCRCPVKGCDGRKAPQELACRTCWRRLPRRLQNAVWTAWAGKSRMRSLQAVRVALEWFRANPSMCEAAERRATTTQP